MSDDHGARAWKNHEEFYLRDGNVCFLVEETTLFRLHKYFFERESNYFRRRFQAPTRSENGSVGQPYKISDIRVDEFAQFVWIWYNPRYSFSKKGKQAWLTILKLATTWEFHDVRSLAVRQLEKLGLEPIEKITLYKEYAVESDLLLPAYVALCRSPKLPSPKEGTILTMKTVLQIAEAREEVILRASELGCPSPSTVEAPDDLVNAIVAKMFDLNWDADIVDDRPVADEVVTVKQPTSRKEKADAGKENGSAASQADATAKGKKKATSSSGFP